ncbi:MAG TPA: hypothetical protein VLI04_15125 [Nocardioidaceae bacterium]|nr:hypothetical protein [Nocardioidaceae bacterium]
MSFFNRAGSAAADPWLGLTSVFGGGVAWAVGMGPWGLAIAGGMFAAGAVIGGVLGGKDEEDSEEEGLPELHKGTEQAKLVETMDRYINDLRRLRSGPKPDAVVDPSIEALVATENAYPNAVRVAAAIDGLDVALSRAGGPSNNQEVRASVQRMADRRVALLDKLQLTVDEVAEVYTKLLEMSAAVSSMDLTIGATKDVEQVNASLDSLRTSLADLETQAQAGS